MKDKKLILRVMTKLLAAFSLIFVIYVLMQGFLQIENVTSEVGPMSLDVSELKPGQVMYVDHGRRKILVLHRGTDEFVVAYAMDPVFGCPVEWQNTRFVSICNGSEFYEDGKAYQNQATDRDMLLLDFKLNANRQLIISQE